LQDGIYKNKIMINDNKQLWNDYMLLKDYVSAGHQDYPIRLNSSVLRLSKYWIKTHPNSCEGIYALLKDTGVRGRVVDLSKQKLPKIDF